MSDEETFCTECGVVDDDIRYYWDFGSHLCRDCFLDWMDDE